MAQYEVKTDQGTFIIETDEPNGPPRVDMTEFPKNIVKSTARLGMDTVRGIGRAVLAVPQFASHLYSLADGSTPPEPPDLNKMVHEGVAGGARYLKNRYVDNFGKTLYEDPAGVASDASTVMSGAGALLKLGGRVSSVPGMVRAGQKVGAASNYVDPLTAGVKVGVAATPKKGRAAELMYEAAVKPSQGVTLEQADEMIRTGIDKQIPVSRSGLKKAQADIKSGKDWTDRQVAALPGTPVVPDPVFNNIDAVSADIATGSPTPNRDLKSVAKKREEHMDAHWSSVDPATGLVIQPVPISGDDALKLRRGTNKKMKDAELNPYKDAPLDNRFNQAVLDGINSELYRLVPGLEKLSKEQAVMIRLKREIDATLRSLRGKEANMSSAYAASQAGKTIMMKPSAVGVAAILNKVLTPQMMSEIAIALKKKGYVAESKRAKLLIGNYNVLRKVRPLATGSRVQRENAEATDPPVPPQTIRYNPDNPYSADNPYAQ